MQAESPFFYICFIPQNIFVKQKISYFCIFLFFFCSCGKLDCKLFVYWKTSFFCSFVTWSCIGDKGGGWAVIAVRVSSFQFLITKNANEGTEGSLGKAARFLPPSPPPFSLISFFLWKKNLQTAARPKTTSIGCLPLGNFMYSLLWRVRHKGSIT